MPTRVGTPISNLRAIGSLVTIMGNEIDDPGRSLSWPTRRRHGTARPRRCLDPASIDPLTGAGLPAFSGTHGAAVSSSSTSRRETGPDLPSPEAAGRSSSTTTRCASRPDYKSLCTRAGHLAPALSQPTRVRSTSDVHDLSPEECRLGSGGLFKQGLLQYPFPHQVGGS
jgi:hypothetical protein